MAGNVSPSTDKRLYPRSVDYTYRVAWSAEDGEYVGTVEEFPSLSHLAPTEGEALAGIKQLVADVVDDIRAHG